MLTLNMRSADRKSDYIYRQIYRQLKKEILLHHFLPHEKLPSKRDLAKGLKVSVNSVNSAYQQLLAEGYIYAKERSGFYVEKLDTLPVPFGSSRALNPELAESPDSRKDWLSFSHMSADRSCFPFDSWLNCEHKALRSRRTELSDDPSRFPQGIYSVRRTISRLLSVTRGVKCFPEQIVLGGGTQVLVQLLRQSFFQNATFAMEEPGYKRIYRLLTMQHADVRTIELDDRGIKMNEINRINPDVLYITPSHQFPTGIVMPISRRIQLLNWASRSENRFIIEDDYDSEFKYECDTIPSLQGLDAFDKVIYIGTFSKSLLPGLRISYMVLPQRLLKAFREKSRFIMQTCSALIQLTLQEFIDSGEYRKHIKRMKQIYSERRMRLIEELGKKFGDDVTIYGANAGLHFMSAFKSGETVDAILRRADEEKLELYGLRRCFLRSCINDREPRFILGFANLSKENIEEGVNRLYRAVYG